MSIELGGRQVGEGHPCFLIAEVGTTCLGNLDMALALVEAGAKAGMDAIKFQLIDADQDSNPNASYDVVWGGEKKRANMREMFSRLEFMPGEWKTIAEACRKAGVVFFATVDYVAGVDLLEELGVPVHKIGAWDTTFRPLIEKIGSTGKPMIVDLGPTTREEIEDLETWYREVGGSTVIHLHDYHTDVPKEINLLAIKWLKDRGSEAGFSSPNTDNDVDFAALALGATMIEKRLVLDRNIQAFHVHESLEPEELADWCRRIRRVEQAIGVPTIRPSQKDKDGAAKYYRSICSMRDVKAGETFTPENLHGKRPGTGLPTSRLNEFWGRTARRDIPADTLITVEDVR